MGIDAIGRLRDGPAGDEIGLEPGPVPPELASLYVVWALVTALFFWLLLGASAGEIYRRLAESQARAAERGAPS